MSLNFEQISTDLYQKIKVRFPSVQIGSAEGKITSEPNLARFFDFDFESNGQVLGRVSIALTEKNGMMVLHSANIVSDRADNIKNNWFDFLKELRQFAKKRLLNFDIRDISKSNLDKRDFQYIAKNNIGEPKMSESKLFGTSKTSYQELGEVKLIVKHSQPVNLNSVNGRTQHIHSIYLENSQGERFKYPYKHLAGARALASHVAEGGTPYDPIGKHVIGLSEELNKLRQYKNYVFRNPMMIEAMGELTEKANYRIAEIKKQLEGLQRPTYYKDFKESFNISELKEVPEEVINDWTERLTIKKFKEDLASVFPYLYRLSETTVEPIEVQELSYDDFTQEDIESDEIEYTKEDSYWDSFEESLSEVSPEFEQVEEDEMDPDGKIQAELEKFLATNPEDGDDLRAFHHKAISDKNKELDDYLSFLYDYVADQTGAGGTEEDGVYDEMLDMLSQMIADKGWSEGVEEGQMSEIDIDLQSLANRGDEEDLIAALDGDLGPGTADVLRNMMDEIKDELAAKGMNDVMRDEDKMIEILWDKIVDEYGGRDDLPFEPDDDVSDKDEFGNTIKHKARHLARKGMRQAMAGEDVDENKYLDKAGDIAGDIAGGAAKAVGAVAGGASALGKAFKKGYVQGKKKVGSWGDDETAKEGNEFAAKVQKLKAMGAKPGTKFKTSDGEEHTLKDAIQRAGLQLEDFYDVNEIMMSEEDEVRDYVKSHFDYTTNRFPRGETSVLTSVSKKFGEEAISLAQEAIKELQTNEDPEIARIRKLSGL